MNQLLKSSPPTTRLTTGMIRSLTSESTILPNAPPMITPTARSTTLPLTAKSRNSLMTDMSPPPRCLRTRALDRRFARFAGADAHDLLDVGNKNLPVPDLSRAGGFQDRLDGALDQALGHHHLDLGLGHKIDDIFRPAVELRMALLPTEALDLGDGEARDAEFRQRLAHFVEFEWLDDGFDFFHCGSPLCARIRQRRLHYTRPKHSSTRPRRK